MKLPAFESLDEKRDELAMSKEICADGAIRPKYCVNDFKFGFNAGVIERDLQWQSKVSKLVEALEYMTLKDVDDVSKIAVAEVTLKEFYEE